MLRFFLQSQPNHPDRRVTEALVARGSPAELDPAPATTKRQEADRSAHADDEGIVFPARTP